MRWHLKDGSASGSIQKIIPAQTFNSLIYVSVIKDNESRIPASLDGYPEVTFIKMRV
jgi:hypothetical protein